MGAKARKKVGGLRASTGAVRLPFSGPTISVPTQGLKPKWQVAFGSEWAAAEEAQVRAKLEGRRYYVLRFIEPRGPVHYSAIDEEVFLMCGGNRGWGRPVRTFNSKGEDDGDNAQAARKSTRKK